MCRKSLDVWYRGRRPEGLFGSGCSASTTGEIGVCNSVAKLEGLTVSYMQDEIDLRVVSLETNNKSP